MHFSRVASTLAMASSALAWMPSGAATDRVHARDLSAPAKTLLSRDGVNLFEERGASLAKPVRGVNLGSLFVFEPWIASDLWNSMCGSDTKSEFDCGSKLGQDKTNQVFQNHWKTFYTQDDFDLMAKYGLNTVRIPVGYWMNPDLVDKSEPFPQGGLDALANVCDMAAKAGLYAIVDYHGAAGAQVASNADTGQNNPNPGFYSDYNYNRSEVFLGWMAGKIHGDQRFRNVGMLEVLNEPEQNNAGNDQTMRQKFYPAAQKAVRDAESAAGVAAADQLTLFYMNEKWGSGDPTQYLSTTDKTAYDDHRYIKWAYQQDQSITGYAKTSCNDDRSQAGLTTIVGEWSLSVADSMASASDWAVDSNISLYQGWFAAQINSYEKTAAGWIFWTWKTSGLNDARWDYQMAVNKKIIPTDFSNIHSTASSWCSSHGQSAM